MGVLEDAIREHIDLRRRHGAAEDELRDQEAEALGPARREEEPEPEAAAPPHAGDEPAEAPTRLVEVPPPAEEDEPGLPFDGAAESDAAFEPDDRPRPEPVLEDEPFVTDEPVPLPEPELEAEEPLLDEPVTEVAAPFEEPFADEPEAEEGLPPEEPAPKEEDEDVLEETPDFLSETPEHDRLWFEQKPPRDFDFD